MKAEEVFTGHSLESMLSCWPVKSAKEISSLSFPFMLVSFLCQRMSL